MPSRKSCLVFLYLASPVLIDGFGIFPVPPSSSRRVVDRLTLQSAKHKKSEEERVDGSGGNERQMILRIIADRFENSGDTIKNVEWAKLKRYLYRTQGINSSQVKKTLHFLEELFPGDLHLQKRVVQCSPRILSKNVKTRLGPTAIFLKELYGTEMFQEAITRNPDLLLTVGTGYQGDELDLVEFFLRDELNLSQIKINQLKKTKPFVFQTSVSTMLRTIHFLRDILNNHEKYTPEQISRIIGNLMMSNPHILMLSEDNLKRHIEYLVQRCEFRDEDLALLIGKSGSACFLGLSVEDNIQPTLDFLSGLLSTDMLRRTILAHPPILALSLQNLRNKAAYFDAIENDNTNTKQSTRLASRILIRSPAVYSLSLKENIIPTVEYLARVWGAEARSVGLDNAGNVVVPDRKRDGIPDETGGVSPTLSTLLGQYPTLLTLSLKDNIQPTVNFLCKAGYLFLDENGNLERCPLTRTRSVVSGRHIAASLFNRLLPRWSYFHLKRNGIPIENNPTGPEASQFLDANDTIPLYLLAVCTDADFCNHMGFDSEDYVEFKRKNASTLKLNWELNTWLLPSR